LDADAKTEVDPLKAPVSPKAAVVEVDDAKVAKTDEPKAAESEEPKVGENDDPKAGETEDPKAGTAEAAEVGAVAVATAEVVAMEVAVAAEVTAVSAVVPVVPAVPVVPQVTILTPAALPPPGAAWAPGGLPATTSAVALRLLALDAALLYRTGEPAMRDSADVYLYSQPPLPLGAYEKEPVEKEDTYKPQVRGVALLQGGGVGYLYCFF
jgi:hypothetical protein